MTVLNQKGDPVTVGDYIWFAGQFYERTPQRCRIAAMDRYNIVLHGRTEVMVVATKHTKDIFFSTQRRAWAVKNVWKRADHER